MKLPEILQKILDEKGTLDGAELVGADLSKADLRGVNLSGANLRYATFLGSDLRRANLRKSNLRHAVLKNADLRETDMSEADMGRADLQGARIGKTRFGGAKLSNINGLSRKTFFSDDDLKKVLDWPGVEYEGDRLSFEDGGNKLEFRLVRAVQIFDFVDGKAQDAALLGKVKAMDDLQKLNAVVTRQGLTIADSFYSIIPGWIGVPQTTVTEDVIMGRHKGPASGEKKFDSTSDADLMSTFLGKGKS